MTDSEPSCEAAEGGYELDCYPYTFSPLLLFSQPSYFDKGYSNYNSVAAFFAPVLKDVDMLENVLYDRRLRRKNMLYEDVLNLVFSQKMLVTCCIDAHFTAFQVVADDKLIHYDPMRANLLLVTGESAKRLATFLLLKCNYGDSQHIQEHKDHYTGSDGTAVRRMIYQLWRDINKTELGTPRGSGISLNLKEWLLVNDARSPQMMSTQQTGNTCYFQVYLFGLLCKVGRPTLSRSGREIDVPGESELAKATVDISRFLLEFFVQEAPTKVMRPLTNSNFLLDFFRYKEACYYTTVTAYLQRRGVESPEYELQYRQMLRYFDSGKVLHKYGKFTLNGEMSSTLNTKSLQPVLSTGDAVYKLAQHNYYKYRAGTLMFGFNTGVINQLQSFCEFNSLRKNQLLAYYEMLAPLIGDLALRAAGTNKYRDYYFMPQFEVGQQELVDVHYFTYAIDVVAMQKGNADPQFVAAVHAANQQLVESIFFSTQRQSNYDKMMTLEDFKRTKYFKLFLDAFMAIEWLGEFAGLGFPDINPKEKEINSLSQTVFYSCELMVT
jgi:hypothetical protein